MGRPITDRRTGSEGDLCDSLHATRARQRSSPAPAARSFFREQQRASLSPGVRRSRRTTSESPDRDFRSATQGAGFEARRNARMTIGLVEPGHWRRSDDAHATRSGLEGVSRFGRDPSYDVPNNRTWRSLLRAHSWAWRSVRCYRSSVSAASHSSTRSTRQASAVHLASARPQPARAGRSGRGCRRPACRGGGRRGP
jgi:hypothetical protein